MLTFVLFSVFAALSLAEDRASHCESNYARMSVLPGVGWDNLRNIEKGMVLDILHYKKCVIGTSAKYLLPDDVFLIPRKTSDTEVSSEVMSSMDQYSDVTSNNVNAGLSVDASSIGLKIGGSFTSDYKFVKTRQSLKNEVTNRASLRYTLYTVKAQPGVALHPNFKSQLMDIAQIQQRGHMNLAEYKAQLLVRNFGTHFLKSVDAGALLVQEDFFSRDFWKKNSDKTHFFNLGIKVAFGSLVNFNFDMKNIDSKKMEEQYSKNKTTSRVKSYGGRFWQPGTAVKDWLDSIEENMASIDRSGDPIYLLITPERLPELAFEQIESLYKVVSDSVKNYYKFNIHRGCTKIGEPGFSLWANVLDESMCGISKAPTFAFGGVFQNCTQTRGDAGNICNDIIQKNPLTGDYSCPSGYDAIKIFHSNRQKQRPNNKCKAWWGTKCTKFVQEGWKYSQSNFDTYWCAVKEKATPRKFYSFGGIYSKTTNNLLTGRKSCPERFVALRFAETGTVCVHSSHGSRFVRSHSVPVAGLYSCNQKNPLSDDDDRACPKAYSPEFAFMEKQCEISYCVYSTATQDRLPQIQLPPFIPLPDLPVKDIQDDFLIGSDCVAYVKNTATREWLDENKIQEANAGLWNRIKHKVADAKKKLSDCEGSVTGERRGENDDEPTEDEDYSDK